MLKLGSFTFDIDDYPSELPTGGSSLISLKQFPGGQQTVQNFGAFDDEIVLSGTFMYSGALTKANSIDKMWRAGNAVELVVSGLKPRWVFINSFKPNYKNDYEIDYEIHLNPMSYSDPNKILYTHETVSSSSSSSSTTPKPSPKPQRTYVVKRGDCLWKISLKYYRTGTKYMTIAKANHIKHPNLIYPGQKLVIP